jgi:hypothetical protein
MKTVAPSARMGTWHHTSLAADSSRLPDPIARRRRAAASFDGRRRDLQAIVTSAVARGMSRAELGANPAFRQVLGAALTAWREERVATQLLAL